MAANGLYDLTWDSSTSASIVFGTSRIALTKLTPGKMTIKKDKPRRVGEPLATKRTPGSAEVGDFGGEMLASDFEAEILPRMPIHGGTLITFPILITLKHPSITGALSVLLDRSQIIEYDGPEITGGDEKALIYKLQFSALGRFDKGRDGKWKALNYNPRRASSDARALMAF